MRAVPLHCNNASVAGTARRWSRTGMAREAAGDTLQPTRRGDFRVLRTITTRWMDNDHYGHVNNVVYLSLIHI